MTNQNNELYQILNDFRQTSLVIQANDSLGRGELGAEAFKKSIETTEQQIQALYAPKPVENGELRETILSILGIVDRTSGNRPEQIATLEQELTAHTNAEIAKVLDTIESAVLGEVTDEEERYEVYSAIQAERAKIKGGVMNPTNEQELREILVNLANQVAANEQRLLNGNATREETINSDSEATMRAEKALLEWKDKAVVEARIDGAIMGAKFGNAAIRQYNIAGKPMNLDEIRDVGIKQAEDWAKRQC